MITGFLGIIIGLLAGYHAREIYKKIEEIKEVLLKEEDGQVAQTRSPLAHSVGKGQIVRPKSPKDIAKEQERKFWERHGR